MPEDYHEEDYKQKINKLGGLTIPLNIFLFQEIQRLQAVIGKVRGMCVSLQQAIKGEVVMTDELQGALQFIYEAKAPTPWVFTIAGDEFSWILPTLGLWFSSLIARDNQDRTWLETRRPPCFWLTGFFNPQGMLTAMKQEVTRKHKQDAWALDDVVYHTDVTTMQDDGHCKSPPPEGLYIHGLFIDGAAWNRGNKVLIEQEPKKLFVPLPVLHVAANDQTVQRKINKEMFAVPPYESPVYKYPARTDRFFIFFSNLRCTAEKSALFWGLRGVALLCNTA